jgi:hypothetical protein
MDWLEHELKRALERQPPAPGFAARLKRRTAARTSTRRWMAVAAALIALAAGGASYRWYQGVRGKDQVMLAMRLAAGKLNRVQARVMEVGQ